ncbi:efflux RND transporter periplasmic adaptor subunit [Pelomonas sp. CA6]|uniref:efflux RND transporter periplasmic adaptor subunit n=1 Tax=Pelomonas sp. CA6 TaxID=2907999 RepID=UPI001F4BDC6D|nr:efflux RND transporter periplasmic adaptor subunit [Pelomonas sp. CA6]MCH7344819.1 efflux RND transporter periplasmic adaptor subunit [Pelomonas sp. CA6]
MFDAFFRRPLAHRRGGVVAACAAIFLLSGPPAAQAGERPAAFAVTAAQMRALGIQLRALDAATDVAGPSYPARVVVPPGQQQIVSAPLAGVVDRLLVGENERVRAGQPLLRLLSPELGELQLRLMEAGTRQALAAKTLQRERQLLAEGIVAERRVQEAEATAAEASARVKQASAALRLAGLDEAQIRRLADGGSPVEGAVLLRSRVAGVVSELKVKPGQRLQPADPAAVVADSATLWLDVQLPVARRTEVATAKGAAVAVLGREGVEAVVASLGSAVDEGQHLVLRAEVRKGAQALRAGEFVQVRLPFADTQGWAVPLQAVARDGDRAYVFVRTTEGFVARPVSVIAGGGPLLRVRGDLQAGQQIAISSVIALKAAWQGKGGGN